MSGCLVGEEGGVNFVKFREDGLKKCVTMRVASTTASVRVFCIDVTFNYEVISKVIKKVFKYVG